MPLAQPSPAPTGPIGGEYYFIMLLFFGAVIGYLLVNIILLYWFGGGMVTAKKAWQTKTAIIQHFETGKNAVFKLAEVTGEAFRHQKIRDGTMAAMADGVNTLGGKQVVLAYSLFGASVPATLLLGIARLRDMGFSGLDDVNTTITKSAKNTNPLTPKFTKESIILEGYDFSDFGTLKSQMQKTSELIPFSIEDISKFINKTLNPHSTENTIALDVQNQMGGVGDDSIKYMLAVGTALMFISIGFIAIYNTVVGSGV